MNPNVRGTDQAPLMAVINPQSLAPGTTQSGWVSLADAGAIIATLLVGAITATGTVDAKLEQASDSAGTGAKDITGKSITQLTQAGTDSNKQVEINCRADELDVENSFTHVRLSVTTATAAAIIAATVRSISGRYQPQADASTVDEVVN